MTKPLTDKSRAKRYAQRYGIYMYLMQCDIEYAYLAGLRMGRKMEKQAKERKQ